MATDGKPNAGTGSPFARPRQRPAGTGTTSKRNSAKIYHVRRGELDTLFAKLEYQIPRGLFHEAQGSLDALIAEKQRGGSEFDGIQSADQVPLGLGCIRTKTLNFLDQFGVVTVGDLDALSDDQLSESPDFGPKRIKEVRLAASTLRREFDQWQAKRNPNRKQRPRREAT